MSNDSQKKADYNGFVFLKDDTPNLFTQSNQAANPQVPSTAIPFAAEKNPVTTPGASQKADIPPYYDMNSIMHGFAEIEQGSTQRCVNPNLSAASSASAMNPASPGADNQSPAGLRRSFNPYAEYMAQIQQGNGIVNGVVTANMQGDVNVFPNQLQTGNQMHQPTSIMTSPAAMMTQPGFIPNGLQPFAPYTNQKATKKKGVKATAYDIMLDFCTYIPMFTHKQEVYIYNATSGAYEKRTQNEVERIIMARYRDIIREHGNGTLIEKVYKLLLKEPQIVRNEVPVSDPTKIAFANCTLDLLTGYTGPHSATYCVTFALNCDLARASHQSEECPTFDKFLRDITGGDEVLIQRIWEFVGYCLTQDTNAKVFFILQGVPDSGKSLLCNLVMDFFPEEKVSSLNVHSLKEHFALENLESVALCVSPDLPASALDPKSASSIKQLTGNDRVSAAVKYKRNTQFRFEGKLILATNYPLLTQEPDDAFMQRAIVIPFFHSIPKEKQDGSLLDRLKAEKPAIASKALEVYFRLRKNHYKFSGDYSINSSLMFPDDLFGSSDITPLVYNFLKNYYEKDPNGIVAISSAYKIFSQMVSNQFTEKMFSSVFQRFSEELYGAEHTRSYHSGEFKNARSSMKGIRPKT